MHQRMALEPAVPSGLVSIQVVQHHVNLAARMMADDLVEEVEELTPPAAVVMAGLHLPSDDVERGEQGGSAMPLIAMAEAVHGPPIGQPDPSLRSLQSLNRGLFVDRQHQRVFRRTEIESHHIGSLGSKLRVSADAPTTPSLQADSVLA